MKERPILFSAPMVRAILDGRKTQTRRVVKPQPVDGDTIQPCGYPQDGFIVGRPRDSENAWRNIRCPYGGPGDRLWVRETWAAPHSADHFRPAHIPHGARIHYAATEDRGGLLWRPSIHMPRWASRITLEIVSVRVERLQEISAKDVLAEGAVLRAHDDQFGHNPVSAFDGCVYLDLKSLWARGWDSINANRAPWESNPWVWAIEFRRVGE